MPTTLPRVYVQFEKEEQARIGQLAKAKELSMSGMTHDLVMLALDLVEDIALGELAMERMVAFDPSKSIDIDEVIEWNRKRKGRRTA